MSGDAAVAVIGGGVVGIACARALQRTGARVVVFDPAPPGSLCSSGNAGHIALDHIRPLARPDVLACVPRMLMARRGPLIVRWRGLPVMSPWVKRFVAASRAPQVAAGTAALAALLGTALADWQGELAASGLTEMLHQQGALNVMETTAGAAAAAAEGRVLAAHGIAFEDLSAASVAARLPGLTITPVAGRYFPNAAHVANPLALTQALAARFVAEGGEIVAAPVAGLRKANGQIAAVITPGGERVVTSIVLAAGLASPALARAAGMALPMTAERGYHAMLPSGGLPVTIPTTFNERGFIVTPMAHGMRLAGTVEFGAAGRAPDWARADILAEHASSLFGRTVQTTDRWQGDRPTLPDYLPALGRAPGTSNMIVAAGHQHLGLTLAATTARIVAALVMGGPASIDLNAFDPGRFS